MGKTIKIAGGGLAGLTLGILLRRDEVPVELWDAGSYPRHRVCGEFISGRGLDTLNGLGLPVEPKRVGALARSVCFFHSGAKSSVLQLPQAALSLDRAQLDQALATEFRRNGGILSENCRWTGSFEGEGVVRATGRRLPKCGSGLVGLKVHARNVNLSADLELHFSDAGYVGISRLKDGVVNLCGLFVDKPKGENPRSECRSVFSRVVSGPTVAQLNQMEILLETFSGIAGISLKREHARSVNECRIGDSICMIPPMTGNGMSIAFESAAIAAPFLRDYSSGHIDWRETLALISQRCDGQFSRRLTFAALLQKIAFSRAGRKILLSVLKTLPGALPLGFRLTR